MKPQYLIIYIVLFLSLLVCGCSNGQKISKTDTKKPVVIEVKRKQKKHRIETINKTVELETSNPKITELTKKAQKLIFKSYYYDSNDRYVQIVKKWVLKSFDDSVFKNVENNNLVLILVDLNNDGKKDIISLPGSSFCSGGPHGCSTPVFLSPDYKEPYTMGMNVFPMLPIYVLDSTTNGVNNLLINEKCICKFEKLNSQYKLENYNNDYDYICK